MAELDKLLPRLIYSVATAEGPILFSKLDITDGYWRMVVLPEDDDWHFAYVLPKASLDELTQLVIPSSIQTPPPGLSRVGN